MLTNSKNHSVQTNLLVPLFLLLSTGQFPARTRPAQRAQGALEYLLIAGAIVAVPLIVFGMIFREQMIAFAQQLWANIFGSLSSS